LWFSDNAAPSKFGPMGRFYYRTEKKLPRRIFEGKQIQIYRQI
jgi:hypothetical protein